VLPVAVRENVPSVYGEVCCGAICVGPARLRQIATVITVFSRFCSLESEHKLVKWRRSDGNVPTYNAFNTVICGRLKEAIMKTQGDLRKLGSVTTRAARMAVNVLFFCVLPLVGSVLAQQAPSSSGPERQNIRAEVVEQNPDDQASESSSLYNPAHSALPNAPSATKPIHSPGSSLTLGDRFHIYRQSILSPYTLVGPALGAGIGQWEDEPPEWGEGGEGYARRLVSGVGRHLIAETIRFGVAVADGEDPRYHPSEESGIWHRTRHVVVETFTSKTAGGTRIPAYSRFVGTYGAAFISNLWYPESRSTAGWALRRGSTALASSLGFNLFQEFAHRKLENALHISNKPQALP
jgi:hypothetical protein